MPEHQNHCWRLGYVLPDLRLKSALEFHSIAFVSSQDERLKSICATNKASRVLIDAFRESAGHALCPGGVIYRSPTPIHNLHDAIVDARNCVALACVLNGWKRSIGQPNNFIARDADYFDFYPRWPSDDGEKICYSGPAMELVSSVPTSFAAQGHAYIFSTEAEPDEEIHGALRKVWDRMHVTQNPRALDYRTLRSLSVAYEASKVPQAMDIPLYDHGKHCSFWVSAIETLAHPGRKNVTPTEVLSLLGKRVVRDARLRRCCLMVIRGSKRKSGRQRMALNMIQRMYKRLYDARNAFLHGNKLKPKIFIPAKLRHGVRLLDVAPLVYSAALEATLSLAGEPAGLRSTKKAVRLRAVIANSFRYDVLEDAFLRATVTD